MHIEGMPILGMRVYFLFWREKKHCPECKKARSERVEFLAEETPHLSRDYAWWLGRLCEIAPITRAAELMGQNHMTMWRLDFERMRLMLSRYKIPKVTRISVDEVYARRKPKYKGESRNERFFTVISDLDTHRVIWVSESRSQRGLV